MAKAARRLEECPHCGATFRAGRLACPECGSDAGTGWKDAEEIDYQAIELPDEWSPDEPRPHVAGSHRLWWALALAALAGMAALVLLR